MGVMHESSDIFYSVTFSYTKYFVHSYIVDVILTISYQQLQFEVISCSAFEEIKNNL